MPDEQWGVSTAVASLLNQQPEPLKLLLNKLMDAVRANPDAFTKMFTHGHRYWDQLLLCDGQSYFVQLHFDCIVPKNVRQFVSLTVVEAGGPH